MTPRRFHSSHISRSKVCLRLQQLWNGIREKKLGKNMWFSRWSLNLNEVRTILPNSCKFVRSFTSYVKLEKTVNYISPQFFFVAKKTNSEIRVSNVFRNFVLLFAFYRLDLTVLEKNDFSEISKNNTKSIFYSKNKIQLDTNLKIILQNCQNNYVERSSIMSNAAKSFDILTISLSVLHNYLALTKLFSLGRSVST